MHPLKQQITDAFNAYASEGLRIWSEERPHVPVLSHVCLKFASMDAYTNYVEAARALGRVTQEMFKGKQITWCRLDQPLEHEGVRLDWLEFVEPRFEQHPHDGVANIGYSVAGLPDAVKLTSRDANMMFRYQGQHANDMAPRA